MISEDEKYILYQNPYVIEQLQVFLREYNNVDEEMFIVYLLSKAQKDFLFFCKLFYPYVATRKANLIIHQGVLILCELLQLDFERKIALPFIINIMPRAGKTTIATILYTAFLFANSDEEIALNFTKSSDTAKDNHRYINRILKSGLFSFYLKNQPKINSCVSFINDQSYVRSATIYTSAIGGNATLVNIDDPNDIAKTDSADNIKVFNVVVNSLEQRAGGLVKNTRPMRVIQQRISKNDLTGLLLSSYKDTFILIKIKEYEPVDVIIEIPLVDGTIHTITRKAGHLINDQKVLKRVERDKQVMSTYMSLYQQEPPDNLDGIVIFKRDEISVFEGEVIDLVGLFITTDLSYTKMGDKLCFCLWGVRQYNDKKELVLLDILYDNFDENIKRVPLLAMFYERSKAFQNQHHKKIFFDKIFIENAGNKALVGEFLDYNLPVYELNRSNKSNYFGGAKRDRALVVMGYKWKIDIKVHKSLIGTEAYENAIREFDITTLETIGTNQGKDDFLDNIIDAVGLTYNYS